MFSQTTVTNDLQCAAGEILYNWREGKFGSVIETVTTRNIEKRQFSVQITTEASAHLMCHTAVCILKLKILSTF